MAGRLQLRRVGDMGYVIEEGSARRYFWVTDYSAHALRLESLVPSVEQDCDRARFLFSGDASEIPYFGINGRRCVLSRELTAEYSTLEFDGQTFAYAQTKKEEVLPSVGPELIIDAPLCDTQDRRGFARRIGAMRHNVRSGSFR